MKHIKAQFDAMLDKGIIPAFEFETTDGYITVDISCGERGVVFEFDRNNMPVYFSGNVEEIEHSVFLYQFDEFFNNLDHYLQEIHQEIMEGYILANGIELSDE